MSRVARDAIRKHQYIGFNKIWRTGSNRNKSEAVDVVHKVYGPSLTPNSVPIVVLHGLLGCMRNWQSMCRRITSHTNRTVIAIDARNHGDSPHSESHDYFDLAADVSKLLTKIAVEKSIIIGHSMGGRTSMILALTEPSKVASQIIVDISPVTTTTDLTDFFPEVLEAMAAVDFKANDLIKAQKEAETVILGKKLFSSKEDMYFILMNIGRLAGNTFGWKCNVQSLRKNFHNIAAFPIDVSSGRTFDGPTLFIGGSMSTFIPPGDLPVIKKFFPNAVLEYVEGVGHTVHAEDPNAFFNVVMKFLAHTEKRQAQA